MNNQDMNAAIRRACGYDPATGDPPQDFNEAIRRAAGYGPGTTAPTSINDAVRAAADRVWPC